MDTLKECLYDLANFMSQNLHPDRLKGFNIADIKNIASYDQIPACVSLDSLRQIWNFFWTAESNYKKV